MTRARHMGGAATKQAGTEECSTSSKGSKAPKRILEDYVAKGREKEAMEMLEKSPDLLNAGLDDEDGMRALQVGGLCRAFFVIGRLHYGRSRAAPATRTWRRRWLQRVQCWMRRTRRVRRPLCMRPLGASTRSARCFSMLAPMCAWRMGTRARRSSTRSSTTGCR